MPDFPNLIFPANPNRKSKTISDIMHFSKSLTGLFDVTNDNINIPIIFAMIPPLLNIKKNGTNVKTHMTKNLNLSFFTDVDFKQYVAYMHNADIPFTIIT